MLLNNSIIPSCLNVFKTIYLRNLACTQQTTTRVCQRQLGFLVLTYLRTHEVQTWRSHATTVSFISQTLKCQGYNEHSESLQALTDALKYKKISPVCDCEPTNQALPSSKSRDTKTRTDIKNPT